MFHTQHGSTTRVHMLGQLQDKEAWPLSLAPSKAVSRSVCSCPRASFLHAREHTHTYTHTGTCPPFPTHYSRWGDAVSVHLTAIRTPGRLPPARHLLDTWHVQQVGQARPVDLQVLWAKGGR